MTLDPRGPGFYLKGFALLWSLAVLGVVFAITDRKRDLCFVGVWAILCAALLCFSSSYGTKFSGACALPNGLLAAYGGGRLLQTRSRAAARQLLVGILVVMALTPIVVSQAIAEVGAPRVDTDLLAAGRRLRELEGTRVPVILTDLYAGAILPGLFGEQVYAGHWSLTPHFDEKAKILKQAGVESSSSADATYDRNLLVELVRDTRADYILLKRTAPAAAAIATCAHLRPVFEGERWIAVSTARWSCE
jgi:hypothetical protein